jgi:hypothetical protein
MRVFSAICSITLTGIAGASAGVSAADALDPREAGARYGQALGAAEVCYGSTVTDKARTLADAFSGADLDAFKAQAATVYDAWVKVKSCSNQFDPNQCKIIMDKSCLAAEAEIGSSGTAIAGLVDFLKH